VPVDQSPRDLFSRDGNLWHLSHEGGNLEDTWSAPQKDMFKLTSTRRTRPTPRRW
jgi:argininosuccinate synthase